MNPTICLLGNSTVRLYATDRRGPVAQGMVEMPTGLFLTASSKLRREPLLQRPLIVCSVQREALSVLRRIARAAHQPMLVYGEDFGPGLPVLLPSAARATVGRDRLAGCKAALEEFPQGALVCDVGTALTVNLVTARGFEGGLIAPGVGLGLQALHMGTSQLPQVGTTGGAGRRTTGRFPAKNTEAAMKLGCLLGVAGAIEKVYREVGGRRRLPLILTGGGGIMIRPLLTPVSLWRPHLVARGVWLAFQEAQ